MALSPNGLSCQHTLALTQSESPASSVSQSFIQPTTSTIVFNQSFSATNYSSFVCGAFFSFSFLSFALSPDERRSQRGSQAAQVCFDVPMAPPWMCLEFLHMISVSSKGFKLQCGCAWGVWIWGGFSGAFVKGSLMHITHLDCSLYGPDL